MVMDAKEIGKRLVELRGEKTQKEVAEDVDISVSALSMYECGARIPRDDVKIRLAKYYDCPIEIFFVPKTHRT